ncbi:hypothetical protein [Noviherbaspirillum sp.]|uniref:hypothetical protein n=1 Tax=Noviherbaspirillum sp. TaxID=1926288 RepID=UPI002FDFD9C2
MVPDSDGGKQGEFSNFYRLWSVAKEGNGFVTLLTRISSVAEALLTRGYRMSSVACRSFERRHSYFKRWFSTEGAKFRPNRPVYPAFF